MQLRSTTPFLLASYLLKWFLLALVPTLFIVLFTVQSGHAETNTDRQKRIDALTAEIDSKVSSSRALNTQSSSVVSQIEALKRERENIEHQIIKNQSDQVALSDKIAATNASLSQRKSALGAIIAKLYVDDSISPLEMLASSQSVADYIDNQVLRTALRDELASSIREVKKVENQLAAQQIELKKIAGQQENQKIAVNQKQTEQQNMLAATLSQSGNLETLTAEMAAERKALQSQQQSSIVAQMGGAEQVTPGTISNPVTPPPVSPPSPPPQTGSPPSTPPPIPTPAPPQPPVILPNGGYPQYLQNCYVDSNALSYGIDPWGYGCRQCVSYTAWKVLQKTGRTASYWGNANQWPNSARRAGYVVGNQPRAQSVAVMTAGPYGHVAWVESVNSNGTLNVSQYNYWLPGTSNGGWGWYSEFRNVSPGTYQAYIYI